MALPTCHALAQSDSATVSGRITDESGHVLIGTRVEIVRTETNTATATETNAGGIYVLRNLRPGVHRMTVERSGFQSIVLEELTLAVQDVLGRNFTMKVGPVNDVITVSASTASLSTAVTTVVDRQFVDGMPLNGRSFQSLLHLTPGLLVAPAGQGMEGQLTVNGQRTNSNYVIVDGVTVSFATNISVNLGQNVGGTLPALTIGGGTNSFVSVDAMQEFRTLTSTYSPEFGRMPGAQISIVTRSGTNRFHGTAYDYFRHEALDARN